MINIAPAPAFFDDCPLVPDNRIINFVNTEFDGSITEISTPVQFDVVPFVDVFLERYLINNLGFIVWQLLPDDISQAIQSSITDFFVGSYKGPFFILNPNGKGFPSASYVATRQEIIDGNNVGLDVLDLGELLDFTSTSYAEKFVSAHNPDEYESKINALYDKDNTILQANGFESFTFCNPGSEFMCEGFCPLNALCSSGALGEACFASDECDSGRCGIKFDGLFLVLRCKGV